MKPIIYVKAKRAGGWTVYVLNGPEGVALWSRFCRTVKGVRIQLDEAAKFRKAQLKGR